MQTRFEKYSSIASSVIITLVVFVILGLFAQSYLRRKLHERELRNVQGVTLASIQGIGLEAYSKTLVLGLNVDCGFCAQSLPFYQRLIQAAEVDGNRTQVIALFPNQESEVLNYVRRSKISCRHFHAQDFSTLGFTGTPTILLVDKNAKVIGSWVGQLERDKEDEVFQAIK